MYEGMEFNMRISNELALKYIKKNKKRNRVVIIRNNNCNYISNNYTNTFFKLPKIYGRYN